jgi:hypothetical protein
VEDKLRPDKRAREDLVRHRRGVHVQVLVARARHQRNVHALQRRVHAAKGGPARRKGSRHQRAVDEDDGRRGGRGTTSGE